MKYILIATDTEEQLQGIIRGIEALDEKHEIGILHGVHSVTEIDEPCQLIAELANATDTNNNGLSGIRPNRQYRNNYSAKAVAYVPILPTVFPIRPASTDQSGNSVGWYCLN